MLEIPKRKIMFSMRLRTDTLEIAKRISREKGISVTKVIEQILEKNNGGN